VINSVQNKALPPARLRCDPRAAFSRKIIGDKASCEEDCGCELRESFLLQSEAAVACAIWQRLLAEMGPLTKS